MKLQTIMTQHYVPPGGDAGRPIVIDTVKDYSPRQHGKGPMRFRVTVPDGLVSDLRSPREIQDWAVVIDSLCDWFAGETPEGAKSRITRTYFDPVHFPMLGKWAGRKS